MQIVTVDCSAVTGFSFNSSSIHGRIHGGEISRKVRKRSTFPISIIKEARISSQTERFPDLSIQVAAELIRFVRQPGCLTMNNVCERNCGEFRNKFN